jgi:acetyl/propionyl-CoA carboxylase alpha subunit
MFKVFGSRALTVMRTRIGRAANPGFLHPSPLARTVLSRRPMIQPIRKLLIANRGEIACRIARTARAHGIATVAVHSDADARALHVAACDEAIHIGDEGHGKTPYLDTTALLVAAKRAGADAVHPGYGFLAETATFAAAVQQAGLVWVGPPPEVMTALGRKDAAKALARSLGVPVVPGFEVAAVNQDRNRDIGYPVLVKAVAGGGGRGMRIVRQPEDLDRALDIAGKEALAAFGDGTLLVEQYVAHGRHVEVQILADAHGHVIHLGERECSLQRRHQKILEETPCPVLDAETRAAITGAAVRLAQGVGYVNAGTVEFLYDEATRNFYFLEVNTRIQVEHPVTELVTGFDLVAWQLWVAQGMPLTVHQSDVQSRGHAVEVRLCAEDPRQAYAPQSGLVTAWQPASGEGVRIDHGLHPRDQVPVHYDALLAKVIAWAPNRAMALHRLDRALQGTVVHGLRTNREFLIDLVRQPDVVASRVHTHWLDDHPPAPHDPAVPDAVLVAAATWLHADALQHRFRSNPHRPDVTVLGAALGHLGPPWQVHVALQHLGSARFAWGVARDPDPLLWRVPALQGELHVIEHGDGLLTIDLDGVRQRWRVTAANGAIWLQAPDGIAWALCEGTLLPIPNVDAADAGSVVAASAAVVAEVHVQAGAAVVQGDPLVSLEAMKMLTVLRAPHAGVVKSVYVMKGDQVAAGKALVDLESQEQAA